MAAMLAEVCGYVYVYVCGQLIISESPTYGCTYRVVYNVFLSSLVVFFFGCSFNPRSDYGPREGVIRENSCSGRKQIENPRKKQK